VRGALVWLGSLLTLALASVAHPAERVDGALEAGVARLRSAAFRLRLERSIRVLRVSEAVRIHGRELCGGKVSPVLGVIAASEEEVPRFFRETARRDFGVGEKVRLLWVEVGYPAAQAGLQAGDLILEVDGRRLLTATSLYSRNPGRIGPHLNMRVERHGRVFDVQVEAPLGCFAASTVRGADYANASMGGGQVAITTGMLRFVESNDEIALILGHEIAHHILSHTASRPSYEADADYMGCYLAARAGFDVSVAPHLWERFGRFEPFSLDNDRRSHPGTPERALALEATIEEIHSKQIRGEPLWPREAP
jgi:membrane-associated protease RseP (regulator of RpoE activity)